MTDLASLYPGKAVARNLFTGCGTGSSRHNDFAGRVRIELTGHSQVFKSQVFKSQVDPWARCLDISVAGLVLARILHQRQEAVDAVHELAVRQSDEQSQHRAEMHREQYPHGGGGAQVEQREAGDAVNASMAIKATSMP